MRIWTEEAGATAIEYGLIIALIAIAIIIALTALGSDIGNTSTKSRTACRHGA